MDIPISKSVNFTNQINYSGYLESLKKNEVVKQQEPKEDKPKPVGNLGNNIDIKA